MKAILFFVASGRVLDSHKGTATDIAAKSGKRVVFRNASLANSTGENPEQCEGVTGLVPEAYAARFPTYDAEGNATPPEGGLTVLDGPAPELNALGLPKGCPEDKEALKEALKDEGVDFHPRMGVEKLVTLFRETVLAKIAAEDAPEA